MTGRRDTVRAQPLPPTPAPQRAAPRLSPARLILLAAAALAVVGAATYALFFSSWLVVHTVDVQGTSTLSADEVRVAAAVQAGTPLARVDTDGVAARVGRMPAVRSVSVRRGWPDTVVVSVQERDPALTVVSADGIAVYDLAGVAFLAPAQPPEGVPVLRIDGPLRADDEASGNVLGAVLEVVAQLPAEVRDRLAEVLAPTSDSIALHLAGGVVVEWGSSEDSARKAQVLVHLMEHPASAYNVTAPDVPAIRPLPTATP